ncbi:MAG TPA: ribonuclease HII [Stellaceae bacterium]|jgi:ribonuclease HII
MPDLTLERSLGGIVCGVDEVGRGPLAGPVLAAAVVLDPSCLPPEMLDGLDDSKALSAARREHWCAALRACGDAAAIGIGAASVREIDGINILRATMLAMRRAVLALPVRPDAALVDGDRAPPDFPCPVHTVVGGDGRCLSIAAASIVAKVTRDRVMAELGRRYAGYGWERNAGYGTAEHREAIRRLGVTPHHRRSFAPVRQNGHTGILA